MTVRVTRRGIPAGVVWGGFGVLAWAAFTILTGTGTAHADEQAPGPLDGLTSLVTGTVSSVTTPVMNTVTQLPVVGEVASPVVKTVTETVSTVTTPVTDLLGSDLVSGITTPVIDVVTSIPVVGDVVVDTGVIGIVDGVVDVVDDTTGTVGGIVDEVIPPIVDSIDPTLPEIPTVPGIPSQPEVPTLPETPGGTEEPTGPVTPRAPGTTVVGTPDAVGAEVLLDATGEAASASATGRLGVHAVGVPAASAAAGATAAAGAPSPTSNDPAAPSWTPGASNGSTGSSSSASGSGGPSAGTSARVHEFGVPPLRAWSRVSGATDDALPSSAIADTDVSPD